MKNVIAFFITFYGTFVFFALIAWTAKGFTGTFQECFANEVVWIAMLVGGWFPGVLIVAEQDKLKSNKNE